MRTFFSMIGFLCVALFTHASANAVPAPSLRPAPFTNPARTPAKQALHQATLIPVPTPRPENSQTQLAAKSRSFAPSGSAQPLKSVLDLISRDRYKQVRQQKQRLTSKLDRLLVDWQLINARNSGATVQDILAFEKANPDWPDKDVFQARLELALWREKPASRYILDILKNRSLQTITGRYLYAEALYKTGDRSRSAKIVRELWRYEILWPGLEKRILSTFSSVLRKSDHKFRAHHLLYEDRTKAAQRLARFHTAAERKLLAARMAVSRKRKSAQKSLGAVPRSQRQDPLYFFSRIQYLRRAGKIREAAQLMLKAPTQQAMLVHPDEWWVERKLISRKLLNLNDPKTAYKIAAGHAALSESARVEAEFHAGWYALSFLRNPRQAYPHFERVRKLATTDRTRARAYFWLGRAQHIAGNHNDAMTLYKKAARFGHVYYGQLAREAVNIRTVGLSPAPTPSQSQRQEFEKSAYVQAIRRLHQAGHPGRIGPLIRHMAKNATTPSRIALIIDLAEDLGQHQFALQAGTLAQRNGVDVGVLAFPIRAIPKSTRIPGKVGKPFVYAIARQESAFHIGAISPANARGLLQLLPSTAKATAKRNGYPYRRSRLTTDPAYNATLGAAHLGELLDAFNGSYSLVAAGYNAGSRRSREWTATYGDPRSSNIDIIDWVERIPFTETRKYVQRVSENLQVYKYRLNGETLSLTKDLKTGR